MLDLDTGMLIIGASVLAIAGIFLEKEKLLS